MEPTPRDAASHRLILALLTTAGISLAVMQTMVIPALPFFQREFETSASWVTWLVTGFLLSSSILTPILGKLADAHGKKRLLVISLGIFGVASLGAACAWSIGSLVAFRALQGFGAAVFPLSFGIIRDEFPPEKVGVAIGTVSSVFGVGGGVGLVASGLIVEHLSWHWLFVAGAVPILASAILIARYVPESPVRTPARPDYAGAAALSAGFAAVLVALSEGAPWGWTSPGVLALGGGGAIVLALWAAFERRVAEPLVDVGALLRPGMAGTNAVTVLVGFSITGFFVLVPGFVQAPPDVAGYGFGASVAESGAILLPFSLAMILAGPAGGALGTRHGRVVPLRIGLALGAAALALLACLHGEAWMLAAWLPLMGCGMAFCLAAIGALVIDHSRPEETGVNSGMNSIMRTAGAACGAQIAAAIVSAHAGPGGLPAESGFALAFAMASVALVAALVPTLLIGGRGRRTRTVAPQAAPAG
ncbi:MAG TPA: MFS transporter [Solirubrobacteraceae bacterium]|nr:MFS transporter [Solirubrobacteraceae bacterium]